MDLAQIAESLQRDAVWIVFLNVLAQQGGLPVPAVPTLLLAGSFALSSGHLAIMLGAAIVASVLADVLWYFAGRVFGYRVLAGLCRLSVNPASCVSQTESRFVRWGLSSLVVAKFVPGISTVAPPIAGALRMNPTVFTLAAAVGAALWAGLALLTGWLLHSEVQMVIAILDRHIGNALIVVAGVAGLWLSWKLWQKYRFRSLSTVPHISISELLAELESDHPPLVLDLRGPTMVAETGPIPIAVPAEHDRLFDAVGAWPKHHAIVTLCHCPEDAGAIQAAHRLIEAGYRSVRPLLGGYDAWLSAQMRNDTA